MAATYNITIEQGAKWTRVLALASDSVAWDLTGYTARMHIRTSYNAATPEITLTTENGRIAIDEGAGEVTLTIDADDTAALTFRKAVYDLELVPPAGETDVLRLIQGTVVLSKEATK